jgi:hypothetical protein
MESAVQIGHLSQRFNVAAVNSPRKVHIASRIRNALTRFNVAAVNSPRKVLSLFRVPS